MFESAKRHDLLEHDLLAYGFNKPYTDWIQTHITECLRVLKTMRNTSHVLFTDASDVIFMNGMEEITKRYMRLGHPPMLIALENDGINAGGWLGERDVAIAILEHLASERYQYTGDPQTRWRDAWSANRIDLTPDYSRSIFRVVGDGLREGEQGLWSDTCMLHFAGGYTDPIEGKAAQMEPTWEVLGYKSKERVRT